MCVYAIVSSCVAVSERESERVERFSALTAPPARTLKGISGTLKQQNVVSGLGE